VLQFAVTFDFLADMFVKNEENLREKLFLSMEKV